MRGLTVVSAIEEEGDMSRTGNLLLTQRLATLNRCSFTNIVTRLEIQSEAKLLQDSPRSHLIRRFEDAVVCLFYR